MQDYESFQELTRGIQNIAIAIGVVIGGGWTLYTFYRLKLVDKAKAELEEQRQKIFQQAVINLKLNLNLVKKVNDNFLVKCELNVENKGTKNANVRFDNDSSLQIFQVEVLENGSIKYNPIFKEPIELSELVYWDSYAVRINHMVGIPFFITLEKPGIYFFETIMEVSEEDKKIANQVVESDGQEPIDHWAWSAQEMIDIEE